MEQQASAVVDYHQFELWRHADDSVSIHTQREEYDVDEDTAYLEACVLSRCLGEELNDAEEVISFRVYDNGTCTATFRQPEGFMQGWGRFKWLRQRLWESSYNSAFSNPAPPEWLMVALWGVEYFVGCNIKAWRVLRGRKPAPETAPAAVLVAAAEEAVVPPDQQAGNVVQFRRKASS